MRLGRALARQARGHWFEPSTAHLSKAPPRGVFAVFGLCADVIRGRRRPRVPARRMSSDCSVSPRVEANREGGRSMLLQDKIAVIYGGGTIGGAVARAFAREGARVYPRRPHRHRSTHVADDIRAAGGTVQTHAGRRARRGRRRRARGRGRRRGRWLDISFNLDHPRRRAGHADGRDGRRGLPRPVVNGVRRVPDGEGAARHMIPRGGGVILDLRRLRRPAARLQPRRPADRFEALGGDAPPALGGARSTTACASSRCGPAASPKIPLDFEGRDPDRRATSTRPPLLGRESLSRRRAATPPCSQPRTTPARSRRRRSTSARARSSTAESGTWAIRRPAPR